MAYQKVLDMVNGFPQESVFHKGLFNPLLMTWIMNSIKVMDYKESRQTANAAEALVIQSQMNLTNHCNGLEKCDGLLHRYMQCRMLVQQ